MLPTNQDFNSPNLNKVIHTLLEIQSTTPIYLVDDNQNFTFDNKTFIAFPWKLEGITESSKGEEPRIKISVSNVTNLVMQILEEGIDNTPVIIRVVREGETEADLEFRYVANSYSYDQENIVFDLTAPVNFLKSFPTGNYSSVCPFVFKGWQCRYSGNKTVCNKTAKQCKEYGNLARFGGFQSEIS